MEINFSNETVKKLRIKLDNREISATELYDEYLNQINEINPSLQALISIHEETALEQAKSADKLINEKKALPLTGIPAGVSDNILTKGLVTSCASKMLEGFIPPFDAAVVERLKESSCVIIGKTFMGEFAVGCSPQAGAAVGADLIPFSLCSDTGGAVRRAASFHGLTGIRPTYGRVSRYGLAALASSMDQIGPVAKTAEDCAIVLNSIAGRDSRDAMSFDKPDDFTQNIGKSVSGLKIAVPDGFFSDIVSNEVRNAVQNAAKTLEKQGAQIINISTEMQKYAGASFCIISSAEATSNLARYDGVNYGLRGIGDSYAEQITDSRNRGFGNEVKRRVMFGNFVLSDDNYEIYYLKALFLRRKIMEEFNEIFKTADAVLTPTIPNISHEATMPDNPVKAYKEDFCTVPSSLAGLPSVSTPCGYNEIGLPMGMTLTGRRFDEKTILQIADSYEREFNPKLFV